MSTPVARSVLTEPDPLGPAPAHLPDAHDPSLVPLSSSPHSPASASSGPLSFKRRTQSRSVRDKAAGILGGILSRSGEEEQGDVVPRLPSLSSAGLHRADAPSHIALPPGSHVPGGTRGAVPGASDEEDEDEEDELSPGGVGALGSSKAWRRRLPSAAAQRRLVPSGAAAGGGGRMVPRSRRSTGASAFLSPSKEPGMLSPGYSPSGGRGGDDGADSVFPTDAGPIVVTPLPKIPIFVLSICMLGEFLSASVCSPFLFLYVPLALFFQSTRGATTV